MKSLKQIWSFCAYNFTGWRRNPRVVITFLLAFILCFLLTGKVMDFSAQNSTALQILEPFIWTFGDSTSILLETLLLILLFCDMPFLTSGTAYLLFRSKRLYWLAGQILFVTLATVIFLIFIFISTTVLCMSNSFLGNQWSDTAAILGYSPAGSKIYVPSLIKTMEMSTPLECAATVFLLMLIYSITIVFLMFFVNIRKGTFWGISSTLIFNLFGFLINPDTIKKMLNLDDYLAYIANLVAAWISPLSHVTYNLHSFGYDYLPKFWQTYSLFSGLIALLLIFCYRAIKKYSFSFTS